MRFRPAVRFSQTLVITFACLVSMVGSAPAAITHYQAFLSGPNESPPNASPGNGIGEVDWDDVAHTMRVQVSFNGLLGTTVASHIHAATTVAGTGTAGVATQSPTFTGFPAGVTSGTYDHTFDMTQLTSYNGPFVTANGGTAASAEAALKAALDAGKSYLNIHTTVVPGGEIRGFLNRVPEPSTVALAVIGAISVAAFARRRK